MAKINKKFGKIKIFNLALIYKKWAKIYSKWLKFG